MKKFIIGVCCFLMFEFSAAQINSESKMIIDSVIIYRDIKLSNIFYYAPNKLELAKDADGKPDFQFLKMRYIGTQCYGDENKNHETNIVQFQVKMNSISTEKLNKLQNKLKEYNRFPKLLPFPISHINSELILTIGDQNKTQKIAESNESEQTEYKVSNNSKSYWTNRFFTFSLENQEAILLEDMLKKEALSLSFSYSFYADTTNPLVGMEMSGSTELLENMNENADSSFSTSLVNRLIYSDTFPLEINVNLWPELIRQIDINESIPPTYAAVTIKNYDFTENLRPELYIKKIEVLATSVNDKDEVIIESKFSKKNPDINSRRIYFPYAVLINKPMKYRITEIDIAGNIEISPWILFDNCNQILDITSAPESRKIELHELEIEVDNKWIQDQNSQIAIILNYSLNNELKSNYIEIENKDLTNCKFYADKNSKITYEIVIFIDEKIDYKSKPIVLNDNYIYFNK
jgi:hypothetical protein